MPRLIIAEKPSVARDLARVLGVKGKKDGLLEGNGWLITWCIGHLAELCEPHEYNGSWKRWNMGTLPMIPDEFQLRPNKRTRKQFNIVKRLLRRRDVSSVINACDAGREGELIFRYVYQLSEANKPIERLWISSMTDEAISQGFRNLQPGEAYDRLWHAARGRSEADWLVGLNATRAMTLRTRQALGGGGDAPLMSIGRVQTPTLAMVVMREHEILNFEPKDYWRLLGQFEAEQGKYPGVWFREVEDPAEKSGRRLEKRFWDEEEANAMLASLQGQPARVVSVERKTEREKPPMLFDLPRLQRTANKRYGYSAKKTLELAQALYEKHKLLTYPRTDSKHLSTDMINKMPGVIQAVAVDPYVPFTDYLLNLPKIPAPRRVFNNSKVSDHHAIIPTSKRPNTSRLSGEEQNIYDLVVRRFLAAFYPDAILEKTHVITMVGEETFESKGKVIVERAWREVIGLPDQPRTREGSDGEEDDTQGLLPALNENEDVAVENLELEQKQTKPPPRYNDASLLASMEGAGKMLDEDELKQALRDSGLGTPATRAAIIETLLSREYVERRKKTLYPTPKGMQLIDTIPVEDLKSAELTGRWEAQLAHIARGEEDPERFHHEVRQYVHQLIETLKQAPLSNVDALAAMASSSSSNSKYSQGRSSSKSTTKKTRAKRGSPKSSSRSSSSGNSHSQRSTQTTRKRSSSSSSTRSSSLNGSSSYANGSSSQATSSSQRSSRVSDQRAPLGACPVCHEGQMIWGRNAWGCNRWKEGCSTVVPYVIANRRVQVGEVRELLERGKVGPLDGFENEQGERFQGVLRMYCSPGRNSVMIDEVD